ncbi:dihydrofolate reductase family protein, partial [Vibrio cholerae O1]|nr:dihydrofolate reductase family protein [Vibrio cholerae O1]
KAREKVQMDRARFMGIMVGVGTVIADNPKLTNRGTSLKNPIRIICDTGLRTPIESEVVATAHECQTIIATSVKDLKAHQPYIS